MKNQKKASSVGKSFQPKNFSPYLSCQRLKKVQSLLRYEESGKDAPDTLLAVMGIDSRYNEGCRELADYLLFGFFSLRQMELEQAGLEEEDIEDVILFVRPNSVSVYCKAALYNYLLPYVTHWNNLQIFCMSSEENEKDEKNSLDDAEDNFKIRSFVSMLEGSSLIGIPYLASSASVLSQGAQGKDKKITQEKDGMALDKWSLIQSYASEQAGRGSTFSSQHSVLNIRDRLVPLYNHFDPVCLEKMVKKSYPLFTRHWDEAVSTLENSSQNNGLLTLEEASVAEHLQCYFKHGQLSKLRFGKKTGPQPVTGKQPFVLFGTGTVNSAPRVKTFTLKSSAKKGQNAAYHMTMQCVAPRCGIACTRTYFFKPADTSESIRREFNDLVRLYGLCVEGVGIAIDAFTAALDPQEAERKTKDHLVSAGAISGLVFDAKCNVTAVDLSGREIKITTGKASPHLKIVRVAAENVKTSHKGENLGSVVFMETFLESSFMAVTKHKEVDSGSSNRETSYILLTEDIPVYREWNVKKTVARMMDGDSNPAILCEDITICSNSPLYSPPCNVDLLFYQDGTVSVCCNKNELFTLESALTYYDSKLPGKVGLLVANFDASSKWTSVPAHMRSEIALNTELGISTTSKCVVFALLPGSKAYREYYAKVLHESQNSDSKLLSIKVVESLSSNLTTIHATIQEHSRKGIPLRRDTFTQTKVSAEQLKISDFLMHFTISSVVGEIPVPSSSVEMILRRGKSTQIVTKDAEEKVSITILLGYPCSGADELSASIVELNKEKVRWVIIRPNAPSSDQKHISTVDRENLEAQLSQAIARKKVSRPGLASRKKMRIMLLTVGFFDPLDIVQCVVSHRDPAVRSQMVIGAATTCISPHSVFLNNKQTFPKFFEMCKSGLISNITFKISDSYSSDDRDETIASVQSLIRSVNPKVAFLSCVNGKLSRQREYELILSESSFESNEMCKERQLLMPALWLGKEMSGSCHPEVSEITLDFSQPLIKGSFCARLRALKSSLTSQKDVGSIYFVTGCVAFLDEPTQQYDLKLSTLVGDVSLALRVAQTHLPTPPPNETNAGPKTKAHHLKFYGSKLNEDALKDWVRKCGRQKPSKKTRRTAESLSKIEQKDIQEDNRIRPLPEGYFFNGSFYVNLMDNRKTMEHPFMGKFIEEYLREENRAIDAYNAKIDKQNIKDIFE